MTINITWQRVRIEEGDKKAEVSSANVQTETLWSKIFRLFELGRTKMIEENTNDSRRISQN